jgi:hypothetical protein
LIRLSTVEHPPRKEAKSATNPIQNLRSIENQNLDGC